MSAEPAVDPASWPFDPLDVEEWSRGDVVGAEPWGGVPGAGADEADWFDFGADASDHGVGGLDSVDEGTARVRERPVDWPVDSGLAGAEWAESAPEEDFPFLREVAGLDAGGDSAADGGLSGLEPWAWSVDDVPRADGLDLAGNDGYLNPDAMALLDFGTGTAELGTGEMDSRSEGAAWLPLEFDDVMVVPSPEGVDSVGMLGDAEAFDETAHAEARRAHDAGEPDTIAELGKKPADIRGEGDVTWSVLRAQEVAREREAAHAEARRARDAGKPYTAAELGEKFGKSKEWGRQRLAEISGEGGASRSVLRGEKFAREREEGRAEARRARDAGQHCTAAELAKKFGKSEGWGYQRLAEISGEGRASRSVSREQGWRRR